MKKALITGIAGQDGSYLADLLLEKGYEVHGIDRRHATSEEDHGLLNLRQIRDRIHLHTGSLADVRSMAGIVSAVSPDECYHLAASSFVSYDADDERSLLDTNIGGTHSLFAAVRESAPECRVFFAGSSEMFGQADQAPQDETTPFRPRSIYGISKVAGYHLARYYRMHHNLFACCGILYNHESPRRGQEFVTRKIAAAAARIKLGLQDRLTLGNLDARRDWGYAPDYIHAMWLMLQAGSPDDYVLATGTTHTVRELVDRAFSCLGMDYRDHVTSDPALYRPGDPVTLCGNPARAEDLLAWRRTRSFDEIVQEMVQQEMLLQQGTPAGR